jgi:hypothetical protein
MLRNLFSFFSMLALGVMSAAGIAALIPWFTGRIPGAAPLGVAGLHFESLLLGLSLGLGFGILARYHWADIPRRIITWFLIRERQFFYYTLIVGCVAVMLLY